MTLVVRNETAGAATIRSPNGVYLGKAYPGVSEVRIHREVEGWRYLLLDVTGERERFQVGEDLNLAAHSCWEVEVRVLSTALFTNLSMQPCVSDWAVSRSNRTIQAFSLGHSPDSLWRYQIRGERTIPDPTIHRLIWMLTARCLGLPPDDVMAVKWHQAAAIIRLPQDGETTGTWIVGLWLGDDTGGPGTILLDEAAGLYDVTTITHEALHSLTKLGDGELAFERLRETCEFRHQPGG